MELAESVDLAREAYVELVERFGMRPRYRMTKLGDGARAIMDVNNGFVPLNRGAALKFMLTDAVTWMTESLGYDISTKGLDSDQPDQLLRRVRDTARILLA